MDTKWNWLKKNYMRIAWFILGLVYAYVTVQMALWITETYKSTLLIITLIIGLLAGMFLVSAIFYHNKYVSKLVVYLSCLGQMIGSVYLIASACLMVLSAIGWDGCVFSNENYWICSGRLENVWRMFPTTSPFHELTYLWGKGFGSGHELYYALATAMFVVGMMWLAEIFEKDKMSFTTTVLTTSVLVAASEAGFYFFFTLTQSRNSWPGVVISVLVLLTTLMLDWWMRKTSSNVDEEK